MTRLLALSLGTVLLLAIPSVALAAPGATACSKLATVVDESKSVVAAHATSVSSLTKGGMVYVRVNYAVDETIHGPKLTEVLVEESCSTEEMPVHLAGYPAVDGYCRSSTHLLPSLNADGTVGGAKAPLLLSEPSKSDLDGKSVWRLRRDSSWGPCPDEEALVKKRPALKDILAKVRALDSATTHGFPPVAATADAAAPPATPSPDASAPPPAPAPPPPPAKSGGCSAAPGTSGGTAAGLVTLALLALVRRSRREKVTRRAALSCP